MSLPVEIYEPDEGVCPHVIKTLLLDDSTFDRARLRRMSTKTELMVDLTEVSDIAALKHALSRDTYDLILIDYRLPEGDGLDVLAHIRRDTRNGGAATIMVTGTGDMETAVTAMRNGCHDFLTKDTMTAGHLRDAMLGALRTAAAGRDRAAQMAQQRELIRLGLTAALMDRDVQGSVREMFRTEVHAAMSAWRAVNDTGDERDREALLVTLNDEDEFVFI